MRQTADSINSPFYDDRGSAAPVWVGFGRTAD